jgi:hypothetical protein
MAILAVGDQCANASNRVVDVLGKLVAHSLANLVIALVSKIIGGGEPPKIRHRFEVPNDDAVHGAYFGMIGCPAVKSYGR